MRRILDRGLTVERNVATAPWNQLEGDRIIAVQAHQFFCSRGCAHGLDLDDWLNAEQELASQADDVLIAQSESGFDISISAREERKCIVLSIAPSSLLVLWSNDGTERSERENGIPLSTLSLFHLPEVTDPENAEVTFRDGRVWLRLTYARESEERAPREPETVGAGAV
jgi:hypothetical protein